MRRRYLVITARLLIWIGGLGILGTFLVKTLFLYVFGGAPVFFLLLLIGIVLYIVARVIG